MHYNAALRGAEDGANEIAACHWHHPPTLFPRANASGSPCVGELLQRSPRAARHGSEGMADHGGCVLKNRKLLAPNQERVLRMRREGRLMSQSAHDGCVSSTTGLASARVRERRRA